MIEAYLFLIGLCFGSFASVLVSRIPQGQHLNGRSRCPYCGKALGVIDLIPLVGFLLHGGTCRLCKSRISVMYPLMEILSGCIFVYAYSHAPTGAAVVLLAITLWLFLPIAIIDIQTHTISDLLNIPLICSAVLYRLSIDSFTLSGAVIGVGFLGGLWALSRGRWVGSGDVVLMAGIGCFLGEWIMVIASLFLTYVIGAGVISVLLLFGVIHRKDYVPFAPLLIGGAMLTWMLQDGVRIFWDVYMF